jgi:S-sulfo-L-cysteine synthase (O-acetyl-L-serine-dependent)
VHASDPAALIPAASDDCGAPARAHGDPLLRSIGCTPLVPLRTLGRTAEVPFELWAKAEYLNPTGSVKDRAALSIVRAAVSAGRLTPGRTLIDASSGNTAVAFAFLGARLGFPVELCVPRNVEPGRLERIRAFGATLVLTDPADGSDGAQREARTRAEAAPDRYFYADQYNNPANPAAHYRTTGPEIWRQSKGRVTHLVAGVGTGGTISGIGRFLHEKDPSIRVIGVEPSGPIHGLEGLKHLPSALRPSTYDASVVDETIRVETEEAVAITDRLAREEGLFVGPSAGAAVAASLSVGRAGSFVVTVLPDGGRRREAP